jgi:hypothetical protein
MSYGGVVNAHTNLDSGAREQVVEQEAPRAGQMMWEAKKL